MKCLHRGASRAAVQPQGQGRGRCIGPSLEEPVPHVHGTRLRSEVGIEVARVGRDARRGLLLRALARGKKRLHRRTLIERYVGIDDQVLTQMPEFST